MTMTTTNTVPAPSVAWPGSTYDPSTGTVALGPFLERDGLARWRIYSEHRMWGGLLAGDVAVGKTVTLETLGLSLDATGLTTVWFVNPQRGAPRPLLESHAEYTACGSRAIQDLFAAAIQIKRQRQATYARRGRRGFEPSEDEPGLMILVDACDLVFTDAQVQTMAVELASEGGEVGVAIVAASQRVTLDVFGPPERGREAEALRANLAAGNLLLFHTSWPPTGRVLDVEVDPSRLSTERGRAYLVDRTGEGGSGLLQVFIAAGAGRAAYRPLPPEMAARLAALPKTWLREEDPTTRLGTRLHTEVGHEGPCYAGRTGLAALAAIPLGLGASASYTVGQQIQHDGLAAALTHWPALNPAFTIGAVLMALWACITITFARHLLWHHDEAPYAGNEILGLAPEPRDG
jgi:hypothetical protein